MNIHQLLKIQSIDRLTPSAVAISFELPSALAADYAFKAGQYLSLEAKIDGEVVRRSYSLCSAPHENVLKVGVKKVQKGLFSSFANDVLKVGDSLGVAPPEGRFVYVPQGGDKEILLVAAGSGITPVLSILKTILEKQHTSAVRLIYGNKTPEEVLFKVEIDALEKAYADRFKVIWVYSQSNEADSLFGRIDQSVINFALNQHDDLPQQSFLCGPEAMIETAKACLVKATIPPENIHFELFTSVSSQAAAGTHSNEGVSLSIIADGDEHQIETTGNKTLLDAALQQKIDVPYSCQGGVCCSCIARVTAGATKMENNQILTDEEVEEGLILTCQAFPTTSEVTIDYDDV